MFCWTIQTSYFVFSLREVNFSKDPKYTISDKEKIDKSVIPYLIEIDQ